ncbi:MAG: hypothetical protein IJF45_04685 [Clostridia bacterium]|nr:hypothetical protein [Clostridia bacterium]
MMKQGLPPKVKKLTKKNTDTEYMRGVCLVCHSRWCGTDAPHGGRKPDVKRGAAAAGR